MEEFDIKFTVKIELSQLDGKALVTGLGLLGCFCTMCECTATEAKDPARIIQLFRIERTIESVQQLYEELVEEDEDGNEYIPTRPNDYAIRQGLTQKPLTTQDIAKNFPVLHARLRSLCFFEQLAYRLNSNVPIMGRGKGSHNIRKKRLPRPRKSLSKKQKQTANSS